MEAFSLLKYWRGGGATADGGANVRSSTTTTIVAAVSHHSAESTDDDDEEEEDDGPFFDLEFTVPDEEDEQEKHEVNDGDEEREDDDIGSDGTESEFKFALSSGSSGDRTDPNVSLSPSDDLFFKGRLVPVEPSSIVFNGSDSESNSKSQFSLSKSATKFRVLMLKFKKSKSNVGEKTAPEQKQEEPEKQKQQQQQNQNQNQSESKHFTVKFKVEEVPIVSLFTRDNSSRASSGTKKSQKQQSLDEPVVSDEKRFSKDVMNKYLKMVKPLYVRVSKRYGEKLGFSGQLSLGGTKSGPSPSPPSTAAQKSPPPKASAAKGELEPTKGDPQLAPASAAAASNVKGQKQGSFPAGLRVVCKHLGKSRSASAVVAAAPTSGSVQTRRRDDSLLQQQDGIQSAILHCKKSFNSSRGK
ncbi:putative membrane-associated kinase regulator 2 [Camellia lanceoleosa]|uniref:Membrane-associated kinase regulator 2 n=1 Tax=Camellia lanceoleosa TaxID=1840588 RepID=A0ACC0FKE4_9ERIC|nr:putative membrane-associated kinase regulator 2 [Camellia lanceoleosa]